MRFTLLSVAEPPIERWLQVGWRNQEFYDLSLVYADGRVIRMESGSRVPLGARPIQASEVLFPLVLRPGEPATAYLRIGGRDSFIIDLEVWRPGALLERDSYRKFVRNFLLGASAVLISVFSVLAYLPRRRVALLAGAAAQLLIVVAVLFHHGPAYALMAGSEGLRVTRTILAITFVAMAGYAVFTRELLRLPTLTPWAGRILAGMAVFALVGAVAQWFWVAPFPSTVAILIMLTLLALAGLPVIGADRQLALHYLRAWSVTWLMGGLYVASILGMTELIPVVEDLIYFGLFLTSAFLAHMLYQSVAQLRLQEAQATRSLMEAQRTERERLARAVDERTRNLQAATARATAADQAKSAFLSMVSHELRAPLHTILGHARILAHTVEEPQRQPIAVIERSGNRLLKMVGEILEFSRGETQGMVLEPIPTRLRSLANHVAALAEVFAERYGVRLQAETDPALPEVVMVDERRLSQVLLNLLDNACKHGRAEVGLSVSAAKVPGDAGLRAVTFEVRDWGPGIPLEEQGKLFEPFYRGADARLREGVGLGLPIARQIVRSMGSEIELESAPGRGSRFFFTLRLPLGSPEESADTATMGSPLPGAYVEEALQLLADGRILELDRWAEARSRERPEWEDFAARLRKRCANVELAGIRRLLEAARGPASAGPERV